MWLSWYISVSIAYIVQHTRVSEAKECKLLSFDKIKIKIRSAAHVHFQSIQRLNGVNEAAKANSTLH
jgi:hypothetical protein